MPNSFKAQPVLRNERNASCTQGADSSCLPSIGNLPMSSVSIQLAESNIQVLYHQAMSGSMHLDLAKGLSWLLPMMNAKLGSLFNFLTFKRELPNIAIIQAYAIPLHIQLLVSCLEGHEMIHDDACSTKLPET